MKKNIFNKKIVLFIALFSVVFCAYSFFTPVFGQNQNDTTKPTGAIPPNNNGDTTYPPATSVNDDTTYPPGTTYAPVSNSGGDGITPMPIISPSYTTLPSPVVTPSYTSTSSTSSGLLCKLVVRPKLGDLLNYVTCLLSKSVIPLIFALATVMFIWGVVQYVINQDEEAKKAKGKMFMIWGIIALAVMTSVWGLVSILGNTFNVDTTFVPQLKDKQ